MRCIALRDLRRNDDGLSLVEVVVSLLVFGLIAAGLAAGLVLMQHVGYTSRIRQLATTMAQQTVETNRAIGVGNLALCQSSNPPATYTGSQSTYSGLPVVTSTTAGCLPYQQTTTSHGVNFTVTNWVIQVAQATSSAGFLQYKKALVVTVAWTSPSPGGSYTTDTLVQNGTSTQAAGPTTTPTTLTVNAEFNNAGTWSNINNSTGNFFDVSVTDSSGNPVVGGSGTTGEGTWTTGLIPAGNYTCTVTAEQSIQSTWTANDTQPGTGETGNVTSVTGPCVITNQQANTFNTYWTASTGGTSGTGGTCTLQTGVTAYAPFVQVVDSSGAGINNAHVTMNNAVTGAPALPGAQNTGNKADFNNVKQDGIAKFANVSYNGPVYFTVTSPPGNASTAPGYQGAGQTGTATGPICLSSSTGNVTITLPASPTPLGPCVVNNKNLPCDAQIVTTITNSDVEANKQYTITIANSDPLTPVSVSDTEWVSTANDSHSDNFGVSTLEVPNGTGYTITVCAYDANGNCNVIWSQGGLTLNGGGPGGGGGSYTYAVTDAACGSGVTGACLY